jgi:outer membrane protein assembly factor BamA
LRLRFLCCVFLLTLGPRLALSEPEEAPLPWPIVIDAIEIHGLWRTAGQVVSRELPWRPGDRVREDVWELGLRRLWNLGVFSRVGGHVERRGRRIVAVFELEERWTVNLLLRFQWSGDNYWLKTGLYDINNFGRYIEAGGYYERFDTHNGGLFWVRNPRLFDLRLDGMFTGYISTRPRPEYADIKTGARLDLTHEVTERVHYGGWAEFMWDQFADIPGAENHLPTVARTIQIGLLFRYGIVDVVRLRPQGWSIELRPSVAYSDAPAYREWGGVFLEWLWFRSAGERWTFAWRSQAAAQTSSQPEYHYFIGGLDLIRGFPDNFIETQLFALINLEVRYIAFDSTWFAIQPAAFIDGAIAETITGAHVTGALSSGVGVRFLIPRFVHSGIHIDAAWPLVPFTPPDKVVNRTSLNIGLYEFF